MALVGFHEGLAVYYESQLKEGISGRGNHAYFTNQFNAVFASTQRWSFGQMLHPVDQSRPFNRHYLGGFEFISWTQKNYGEKTARDVIDFMGRWPFMGYGVALWYATGQWPSTGFELYLSEKSAQEQHREAVIAENPIVEGTILNTPSQGNSLHHPIWIDNSTLLIYGQFYDKKSGFYTLNTKSEEMKLLFTGNSVEDFKISLHADKHCFVFARYKVHPKYDNTFNAELVQYDFSTQKLTEIVGDSEKPTRLYHPQFVGDEVWAFQTLGDKNRLVKVNEGTISEMINTSDYYLMDMDFEEHIQKLALVANHSGKIGIWISEKNEIARIFEREPKIYFKKGSLYDPFWSKDGQALLFSSDFTGTLNVYEYQLKTGKITQISNAFFNAFEASYSPDQTQIVWVLQKENEQKISILNRSQASGLRIESDSWQSENFAQTDTFQFEKLDEIKPYRAGIAWLLPRAVIPSYERDQFGNRYAATLYGTDFLQRHTYIAEFSTKYHRFFYDISYHYSGNWPGFILRALKQPSFTAPSTNGFIHFAETGYSLEIPFKWNLEYNVVLTDFIIRPKIGLTSYSYAEATNPADRALEKIINSKLDGLGWSFTLFSQFNYKLVQKVRDLQPSEGLSLFAEIKKNLGDNPIYTSGLFSYTDANGNPITNFEQLGIYAGAYQYIPNPLFRNHSLRLGVRTLYQPHLPVYSVYSFAKNFDGSNSFWRKKQIFELSTRYTFPLLFSENGAMMVPFYLQNFYGTLFSQTYFAENETNIKNTVLGAGLRYKVGLGNLRIDLGISIMYHINTNAPILIKAGEF